MSTKRVAGCFFSFRAAVTMGSIKGSLTVSHHCCDRVDIHFIEIFFVLFCFPAFVKPWWGWRAAGNED